MSAAYYRAWLFRLSVPSCHSFFPAFLIEVPNFIVEQKRQFD